MSGRPKNLPRTRVTGVGYRASTDLRTGLSIDDGSPDAFEDYDLLGGQGHQVPPDRFFNELPSPQEAFDYIRVSGGDFGYASWGGGRALGEFPKRIAGLTIASWVSLGVSLVLYLLALVFIVTGSAWETVLMYALLFLVIGNWVVNVEDK